MRDPRIRILNYRHNISKHKAMQKLKNTYRLKVFINSQEKIKRIIQAIGTTESVGSKVTNHQIDRSMVTCLSNKKPYSDD